MGNCVGPPLAARSEPRSVGTVEGARGTLGRMPGLLPVTRTLDTGGHRVQVSVRAERAEEDLKTPRMEGMSSFKKLAGPSLPQAVSLTDCRAPGKKKVWFSLGEGCITALW